MFSPLWYDSGTLWRQYGMQCGTRLPSVRARILAGCGIWSQRVRLPVRCSAVISAGYELALGGSQICNIWLPTTGLDWTLLLWQTLSQSLDFRRYFWQIRAQISTNYWAPWDQSKHQIHLGHFGVQRMKQLARSAVYWPHIDEDIETLSRSCTPCEAHQNETAEPANHPWMLPEKPWSRLHVDHAINFMGTNWLVMIDAYSKYPCIHPTSSISSKTTMTLLEQDFAHFGYPHTIVTYNATCFLSEEFQSWCRERWVTHLTGASYHPATNGAAERLVQTFKHSVKKSSLLPKNALQEFLMQYRCTPLDSGSKPSELLNGRQIRSKLDALLPSPAHAAQGCQAKAASKKQSKESTHNVSKITY